jgi:hypothetical protein
MNVLITIEKVEESKKETATGVMNKMLKTEKVTSDKSKELPDNTIFNTLTID